MLRQRRSALHGKRRQSVCEESACSKQFWVEGGKEGRVSAVHRMPLLTAPQRCRVANLELRV